MRLYTIKKLDQRDGFMATWVLEAEHLNAEQLSTQLGLLMLAGYRVGENIKIVPEAVN